MYRNIQAPCLESNPSGYFRPLRKSSFTLLEMMIVLALLLTVAGAVTFNFRAAIDQARFKGDVRGFEAILRSVDEAVQVGFDPFLTVETQEGGLHLVYQEAMGRFKKRAFDFPSIEKVFLKGAEVTGPLFFGDRGALFPEGEELLLVGKGGNSKCKLVKPFEIVDSHDNLYPEWIREACAKKEKEPSKKNRASSS